MMIAGMLTYATCFMGILVYCFDTMPSLLKGILLVSWVVVCGIACASEEKLRDRVKELEDKVKKLEGENGKTNPKS